MKKTLCLFFTFLIAISSFTAYAEDVIFDVYDAYEVETSDEMTLMEIDESLEATLKERFFKAWEDIEPYNPKGYAMPENAIYVGDLKILKSDISVYSRIVRENPTFYYVQPGFSGAGLKGTDYMGYVVPKYTTTDKTEIQETRAKIDKATEEILFNISPDMTDFEKVMTVHDYMDLRYVYDIEDMDQSCLILLDKRGVCAAYAEAFQHVMNVLGIEGTIVTGKARNILDTGEEIVGDHMWNMVKIDGKWYHADITSDDPVPDQFAEVCHEFMLLSESALEALGKHFDFVAPYEANSTTYDNASWHDEMCALVTIDGILYRAEGNNLIDENGNVIYEDLDGGDNVWNTGAKSGVQNVVFAGLCEINGVLYFNTDTGIYSYNPKTKETECVKEEYGIFGLYADKNVILYSTYDFETGLFVKKGELKINDVRVAAPYYEDGEAVIRLYNDCDAPLWVISEGEGYMVKKVENKGFDTLRFKNGESQTIYAWKNSLEPLIAEFIVTE